MHYIRHKCINTGEVYYTYIIFDSFKHLLLLWKVCYHWMNVLYNVFESNVYYYFITITITTRVSFTP